VRSYREPSCAVLSLALLSALFWAVPSVAAEDTPIIVGTRTVLRSEVLGEERPLLVSLPQSYSASPTARYPVLYLLDGESHFLHVTGIVEFLARHRRMPEMIVVAVPNTGDRTRDLTPPPAKTERVDNGQLLTEVAPTAGGADRFLRFLTEELVPNVDARYRTQPYRVLVGHSFGGLFAVHALVHKPESFQAYVAISPSLQWNSGELARSAPGALSRLTAPGRGLYLTMGTEGDGELGPIRTLARALQKRKPSALRWRYDEVRAEELRGDDHGTMPHRGTYEGLKFLFSGWNPPETLRISGDLTRLEAHYMELSRRMGYAVLPPEQLLNSVGYRHLREKRIPQALAAFERNVALYPDSANVYDSLGEALEAAGRLQEALKSYERAVALGRDRQDSDVPAYQRHVEGVRTRLATQSKP
jgi:predicted alpha/beta superfamily hydrolase